MAEKTTVAFRVDESVKQEWEDAAEGPEYDSISHLIRLAVQREIADTQTTRTDAQTDAEATTDSEVLQSLTRIERTVTDMQDEMEALGRESRAEELYDLKQVLLEVLPTASKELDPTEELEPDKLEAGATTPHSVAGRIGADTSDVADALERLDENTGQVRSVEDRETGETYYWGVE
jgi:antitoxin component of RelBE/YafQ-DinJ toxin-antitoxin module